MFNILEYLFKLQNLKSHSTWKEASCPVCDGRLKISTSFPKSGSYACYTNYCHNIKNNRGVNLIRAALEEKTPFSKSSIFRNSNIFKRSIDLAPIPKPITAALNLVSDIEYIRPSVIQPNNTTRQIYFDYGEFIVVRVDIYNIDSLETSKYFYPLYKSENTDSYIKGTPSYIQYPFYRKDYISKDLVIVEGEKCASFLQKHNINAISIYSPYSSSYMLNDICETLQKLGVENILYLPDNDVPGKIKAEKLINAAWKANINASSINIIDLYPEYSTYVGFDIVDLYLESKVFNTESILALFKRGLDGVCSFGNNE